MISGLSGGLALFLFPQPDSKTPVCAWLSRLSSENLSCLGDLSLGICSTHGSGKSNELLHGRKKGKKRGRRRAGRERRGGVGKEGMREGRRERVKEFISRQTATLPGQPQSLHRWACSSKDSAVGINSRQRCAVKGSGEYGKPSWRILHWAVPKLQDARAERVRDMPSQEPRAEIF